MSFMIGLLNDNLTYTYRNAWFSIWEIVLQVSLTCSFNKLVYRQVAAAKCGHLAAFLIVKDTD